MKLSYLFAIATLAACQPTATPKNVKSPGNNFTDAELKERCRANRSAEGCGDVIAKIDQDCKTQERALDPSSLSCRGLSAQEQKALNDKKEKEKQEFLADCKLKPQKPAGCPTDSAPTAADAKPKDTSVEGTAPTEAAPAKGTPPNPDSAPAGGSENPPPSSDGAVISDKDLIPPGSSTSVTLIQDSFLISIEKGQKNCFLTKGTVLRVTNKEDYPKNPSQLSVTLLKALDNVPDDCSLNKGNLLKSAIKI